MKNILSMLFFKLKKTPSCLVFFVLSAVLMNIYLGFNTFIFNKMYIETVESIPSTVGTIWIYMILFTNAFLGKEFSDRTMKNHLATGVSRASFFFAYLLMTEMVMVCYYLIQTFTGILIGALLSRESLGMFNWGIIWRETISGVVVLFIVTLLMVSYHFIVQKDGTSFGFALLIVEGIFIPVFSQMSTASNFLRLSFYANVALGLEPSRFSKIGAFFVLIGIVMVVGGVGLYIFTKEDIEGA